MKNLIVVCMMLLTIAAFSFEIGTVVRAVDGDTLKVDVNGEIKTVRLLGVDTPESVKPGTPVQPGAIEASNFTKKLEGMQVLLTYGDQKIDFFGRTLAYVWVDHPPGDLICWNLYLIQLGYGDLYDKYTFTKLDWFREELNK